MIDKITDRFPDTDIMKADGFDAAVIGYAYDFAPLRLIYSVSKCLDILMERDGMTREDATEYFTFNCSGAYMGERTPIWCWDTL